MQPYVFADVYTGDLGAGLSLTDSLGQIVSLETDLLEKIRIQQRRGGWVLLAFSILSNMVISGSWPACCIAAVSLASLTRQYPPDDMAVWDAFVAGLMNKYKQLGIDSLAQACFAYLALTTSNPRITMTPFLPEALSQASFDTSVRVPELLAKLAGRDVAFAHDTGSLSVVFVGHQHRTAVFSRIQNSADWSFSVHPIEISIPSIVIRRITWGSRPEQSIDVDEESILWRYVYIHCPTLFTELTRECISKLEDTLAEMRRILQIEG